MAKRKNIISSTKAFEKAVRRPKRHRYVLRLYVAGMTPKSREAIRNIKEICETNLKGRYDLEVIDIYQSPELASGAQIVAAPTLVRKLPAPLRRFIGDLADRRRIIVGLDIKTQKSTRSD